MKNLCIAFGLLLLVILVTCKPPSKSEASSIRQYLQENHPNFSGAILATRDDRIILKQGFGMADYEKEIANTTHTQFLIASMTKQFTAMGIIILQERGRLNVNDPICQYIRDCPEAWETITIHQLLTHTAGIPDRLPYSEPVSFEWTPDEVVATFENEALEFTPGTQYDYCNPCYILLGQIIVQASGETYASFMAENIFEPLGMPNSGYDPVGQAFDHPANGYFIHNGEMIPSTIDNTSVAYSAGGLHASVEDLYIWDQALYTEQLVSWESLEAIFHPYIPVPFEEYGGDYGYGWFITEHAGHRMITHGGLMCGFTSFIARFPNERVTVIVLSNVRDGNSEKGNIALEIANLLFAGR